MKRKNIYLLIFILVASSALIGINYYTIKILSAVRSYINGESEYSKGQKDASLYLFSYIATEDSAYMGPFNEAIWVPMADNYARNSLLNNYDDSTTTHYFLMGRNHPDDIPGMIWLFKTFRTTYMKTPIMLWTDAETQINQLYNIGIETNIKIKKGALTAEERLKAVKDISAITTELYKKESKFSMVLGETARKINTYLLLANVLCIFVIIGSISLYVGIMIRGISTSYRKLKIKNKEVIDANKELDILIYSVSHDLRSPITSIQGLIRIADDENDPAKLKEYLDDISKTVDKQDAFVLDIISFFKQKRSLVSFGECSLKAIIDDVLGNNKFNPLAAQITITSEIILDKVYSDELRLRMIVGNLISNAIKYSDTKKKQRTISIKTYGVQNEIVIEVADNGVGIDKQYMNKIYNMFFVTSHLNSGTGLGLYILRQNVDKLKGRVTVESELNVGTKFTVTIPAGEK